VSFSSSNATTRGSVESANPVRDASRRRRASSRIGPSERSQCREPLRTALWPRPNVPNHGRYARDRAARETASTGRDGPRSGRTGARPPSPMDPRVRNGRRDPRPPVANEERDEILYRSGACSH